MKIALIGYGKMGKTIEQLLPSFGHEVGALIDKDYQDWEEAKNCDVAIEFSTPETVMENIEKCAKMQLAVVVGTTAWYSEFDRVKKIIADNNTALFYATNFSIGVNLFWKLNEQLAKWMNEYAEYDIKMEEIHHTQKLDSPSGTAITTAEKIISQIDRKKSWKESDEVNEYEIAIKAHRIDNTPGTHIVYYDSAVDQLLIRHEAKGRLGFAKGAIIAANFLKGKKGIYTMDNLLNNNKEWV